MEVTYTLKHPIKITKSGSDEVIDEVRELILGRIKGRQARAFKADSSIAMSMEMLAASAAVPPSTIDRMDFEDILAAIEVAANAGFFGALSAIPGKF